ncbi:tryptophan--tRNA ligase [Paractinoplanes rishiriensis]|uniref:Tryptophan--tRNA ligase n=1 Tax=Paractinoplanes rishiriensis TaxID=1050105 RepID=A0A919MYI5_9ACTN|nr:tryptophan--tRNA ligase [Actinoplanes rishiriensis]GIF00239.1 tryptophan--tRNA ligase 1 [Actinoplanes rishiriensis]
MTRRLTGFQPTGKLHLGNLLGAMRPLVARQHTTDTIAMIADLHALTLEHDPATVRATTLEVATVLLAAGIDPQRTPIIANSQIPEHVELHYLLECTTGFGEAARMIQFKEKSAGGGPVRLSLLTYPVLMAADILVYDVQQVPVGDDQNQHLELSRTLATRFNARYGETFTVPEGVRPESSARIMDLAEPTRKMSKSASSTAGRIGLLDPPEVIRRTIGRAVTDAIGVVRHDPQHQPGVTNLLGILAECTGREPGEFSSYGALKREVTDAVEDLLAPIRARYAELSKDPGHVREILAEGKTRVRPLAQATVRRARAAIGLLD